VSACQRQFRTARPIHPKEPTFQAVIGSTEMRKQPTYRDPSPTRTPNPSNNKKKNDHDRFPPNQGEKAA
jgi:hypothetical protein